MTIERKEEKMKHGNLHDVFRKLPYNFLDGIPQQQCPRTIEKDNDNFE